MCGVCKDCKWWTANKYLGECSNPKILTGYYHDIEDIPSNTALIEDDEGWAWFVGPEFGCIHFEND